MSGRFTRSLFMNDYSEQSIRGLGRRSSAAVIGIASFFAMIGGAASLAGMFTHVPLIWAAWIPLCFLVIPPVHFLCREFLRLQERVRELEKKLEAK